MHLLFDTGMGVDPHRDSEVGLRKPKIGIREGSQRSFNRKRDKSMISGTLAFSDNSLSSQHSERPQGLKIVNTNKLPTYVQN